MPSRPRLRLGGAALLTLLALALSACAQGTNAAAPAASSAKAPASTTSLGGTITVFAAASLTQTFTELGHRFEQKHPGVTVRLAFDGSSNLVTQMAEGAPADVFASADQRNMDSAATQKLVTAKPVLFATNTLEIAVPKGNPAHVKTFADLAKPGIRLVVCAVQVPCGSATTTVAKAEGVMLQPVSEENSVTDVLGKVSSGEADAGLVYRTDVKGAKGSVTGIEFPEADEAVNRYPIAVTAASAEPATAQAFVDFVTGATGEKVLGAAGFGAP